MIFRLFRRNPSPDTIAFLYGTIVAQARAAAFYRDYRVPDTVNGRFEMIVLHLVLLLRRLGAEPAHLRATGQAVFDRLCSDIEENLREMGVADLTVPRRMRGIGEAFYGRQAAYEAALGGSDGELSAAIARNVFATTEPGSGADRLAGYVREMAENLARQDGTALGQGQLAFPDPETIDVAPPLAPGESATS
jgi:cytochrome b pre-mRNA-processing protein 3